MLTIHHLPELRQPIMLCAVSGWSDAGSAASGALSYLLQKWSARRFAEFDSDQIYNYTVTRPATSRVGGRRRLHWPEMVWFALPVPHAQRDLILLVGPEPDLRWKEIRRASLAIMERLSIDLMLTLGAFYAQVPHTGSVKMFGRSYDGSLDSRLKQLRLTDTDYQGPTGFVTSLADAAESRGVPAAGLWAAAPMYLQGTTNPKLSAALLTLAERLLDMNLGVAELDAAGRDFELRINEALRDRPDFQRLVQGLGGIPELAEPPPEAPAEPTESESGPAREFPTKEEVLRELEDFLREVRDDGEPPP